MSFQEKKIQETLNSIVYYSFLTIFGVYMIVRKQITAFPVIYLLIINFDRIAKQIRDREINEWNESN